MATEYEVIIVGAGAAGIAVATRLLDQKFTDFLVLEASDRIGGRVHSVRFGQGIVDLGAEWVHGQKGNIVWDMAKPLDLLFQGEQFFSTSQFSRSDGTIMEQNVVSVLFKIADGLYDNTTELQLTNGSLGDFFERKYWAAVKPLVDTGAVKRSDTELFLAWAEKMYCSIVGSPSWDIVSATENTEYDECEGNQLQIWKQGGFATVLDLLTKKIPNPISGLNIEEKIVFNKEVTHIDWQNLHVTVTCADGSKFRCRRIILTASLGVLKAKFEELFTPVLPPAYCNAIKGLAINVIDKIFLEFPYRWWPVGAGGISCIWTPEDLSKVPKELLWTTKVFGFYRNDSQPLNVLCGWVGGEAAAAMEALSAAQVKQQCMALLRRFAAKADNIPEPISIRCSSWYSNPHIRGSYSYRTIESDKMGAYSKTFATPVSNASGEPVLLFAGEATSEHYFSTVHGAIETGWRAADLLLRLRNPERRKVIVVGGGVAGLAAARTLASKGVDAVVLEAQNYLGGRIFSVPSECGWVELGAQWLHGENHAVYQIAAKHHLLSPETSLEGLGRYCRIDGSAVPDNIVREVATVVEEILEYCERYKDCIEFPQSMEDELERKFSEYLRGFQSNSDDFIVRKELLEWHRRFLLIDNSCETLKQLSAKAWGIYEDCGYKHCLNFKECYRQLVEVLVADLPKDSIYLNKIVRCIEWCHSVEDSKRIRVWGDDFAMCADHVIVTSSLGYLKKNHRTLFHPPLPSNLVNAIELLGFSSLVKLFVLYTEPWWSATDEGFQLVWSECVELEKSIPWARGIQGFDVIPGQPALLCWLGGHAASILSKTSESDISEQITMILRQFTGNSQVPTPFRILRSQWLENEYILGAYSHVTPACDEFDINHGSLQEPVYYLPVKLSDTKIPAILLAGEACSLRHYSTVHGAYESGENQAHVILDHISESNGSDN